MVTLLSHQKHSNSVHPGCYTKDVPSFATMIAAEASRWETSAVDAALFFLDMMEREEGEEDHQKKTTMAMAIIMPHGSNY